MNREYKLANTTITDTKLKKTITRYRLSNHHIETGILYTGRLGCLRRTGVCIATIKKKNHTSSPVPITQKFTQTFYPKFQAILYIQN